MVLDPRKLRDEITVERENLIDNGKGGRTRPPGQPVWLPVRKVWAQCIPLRGGEALTSLVERSVQLWKIVVRAEPGFDTSMRAVWRDDLIGDVVANIRSLAPNEERDGLIMTAESGKP